jgi:ATP-dependent Clp protease, protease subunit
MQCLHKRQGAEYSFSRLLNDRIVVLQGEMDDDRASLIVAKLLYLNLQAAEQPMHLYLNSPGGFVTAGGAILDTIDHVKAPVYTYCIGEGHGLAAWILAHGSKGHRFACRDARCCLVPTTGRRDVPNWREHLEKTSQLFARKLALDTGQSEARIVQDTEAWFRLDAEEAVAYGLIDSVVE